MPTVHPVPIPTFLPQLLDFAARHTAHTGISATQLCEIHTALNNGHCPVLSLRQPYDEDRYDIGTITLFITPDSITLMQGSLVVGGSLEKDQLYIRAPYTDPYLDLPLTKTVALEPIA